jgi:O-antigen/teichoic acid export membrane protein
VLLVRTVNITLASILNSRGQYSVLAKVTATTLLSNAVLALLLIPKFGIEGAAWAAFGTELWNMAALGFVTRSGAAFGRKPVYGLVNIEPEIE